MVNGVFLVALCVSIFLEAIQRLVEPQEVQSPMFVCIVGCFGLLSNIFGLFLFHEHSHGHGHGDDPKGEDQRDVEQGYARVDQSDPVVADKRGSAASVMPENLVGRTRSVQFPTNGGPNGAADYSRRRRTLDSQARGCAGPEDIYIHPASLRQDIIQASRTQFNTEQSSESETEQRDGEEQPSERTTLLRRKDRGSNYTDESNAPTQVPDGSLDDDIHKSHNHAQPNPRGQKVGGHDLNLRGIFLHVMGDALGNIGVIVSALIIWLTNWRFKHYVDPGISLMITVVILCSAIPLCKAASRILLQAVPRGLSIDHIKEDIETLPGVRGSHHLHVWQLSDTKIVASIHLQVDTDIKGEGSDRYMHLAKQVRKCLHAYGIHSSTIQPEFAPDSDSEESLDNPSSSRDNGDDTATSSKMPSRAASVREGDPRACLLECGDDCARGGQCCPKTS